MAKSIHSMIRVFDLESSIDFYNKALSLTVKDRFDFDTFTLVYLGNEKSDFEIELTYNKGNINKYTHGNGYGHLAVSVNDIRATHKKMKELDLNPGDIKEMVCGNATLAVMFFISDPDGYKIEFIESAGRFK